MEKAHSIGVNVPAIRRVVTQAVVSFPEEGHLAVMEHMESLEQLWPRLGI